MISNRFAFFMIIRVSLLIVLILGFSLALINDGYYAITLLLGVFVAMMVFSLYRYVSRTNTELLRFLDALRYGDFSQNFRSSESSELAIFSISNVGAGFSELSDVFSDIIEDFKLSRQQQEEKLRYLKSLTEHIPVPLLSLSLSGHIQLHNNAARQLFSHVNVDKTEDLKLFGKRFYEEIINLEPGNQKLVNFMDEGVNRQMTAVATRIITGTITENLISLQDIQNELDIAQLQAWQELVRVLTHEIMNSITPVASLAKTATDLVDDVRVKLNSTSSADVVQKELEDVYHAVDTVARRSDGLVQFVQSYRSLTVLSEPKKQVILLAELFERVKNLLGKHLETAGVELNVKVVPGSLQLNADPDLLDQVLINLLKNAEQAFSSCDKLQASQTYLIFMTGRLNHRGHVMIDVEDSGSGIHSDIADKIFVPFFSTKKNGTGVGLALVRQIMIAHGGGVTVNESDMGGAKFTLFF